MVAMAVGIIAAILLAPTVLLGALWIWSAKRRKMLNRIPGPPELPFIGNAHQLKRDKVEFFQQFLGFCRSYGEPSGIFRVWVGLHPTIGLTKAETAEEILRSSKNITKARFYDFLVPWLGTGLLTSTGKKWHSRRKMLTPTFHFKILNDFLQVFNEQAVIMIRRLNERIDKGSFDIMPYVTLCALDVICDSAMGRHVNAQENKDSEYVKAVYRLSEIVLNRMKMPWQWLDFVFSHLPSGKEHHRCLEILHSFTDKVIRERRLAMEQRRRNGDDLMSNDGDEEKLAVNEEEEDDSIERFEGKRKRKRRRLAFLDLLLQANFDAAETMSDEDIREEVDTFMFEGHDTTAAAVSWAIHLLGANPEIQKKFQDELDGIFGDSDRPVTMDDINRLKYLECVIKESLRLFPSVPIFGRRMSEDSTIGGYSVPKGASILIATSYIHMDSKQFPDPERFDPDRWLPENSIGRHPFAFVPFSAGSRNCIGQKFAMMEEKVLLTYIFRRFIIVSLQNKEELRPCGDLILRPEDGIIVKIGRRKSDAKL